MDDVSSCESGYSPPPEDRTCSPPSCSEQSSDSTVSRTSACPQSFPPHPWCLGAGLARCGRAQPLIDQSSSIITGNLAKKPLTYTPGTQDVAQICFVSSRHPYHFVEEVQQVCILRDVLTVLQQQPWRKAQQQEGVVDGDRCDLIIMHNPSISMYNPSILIQNSPI